MMKIEKNTASHKLKFQHQQQQTVVFNETLNLKCRNEFPLLGQNQQLTTPRFNSRNTRNTRVVR